MSEENSTAADHSSQVSDKMLRPLLRAQRESVPAIAGSKVCLGGG